MKSAAVLDRGEKPEIGGSTEPTPTSAGFVRRAGAFVKREFDDIWPPTLFFIIGFNLTLLTTNLILSNYGEAFSTYLVATVSALVVGKVVPVVNATSLIRRYHRAPLIQPILFKTVFYWVAVFIARLIEHWNRSNSALRAMSGLVGA
jgi:hypothetical protein